MTNILDFLDGILQLRSFIMKRRSSNDDNHDDKRFKDFDVRDEERCAEKVYSCNEGDDEKENSINFAVAQQEEREDDANKGKESSEYEKDQKESDDDQTEVQQEETSEEDVVKKEMPFGPFGSSDYLDDLEMAEHLYDESWREDTHQQRVVDRQIGEDRLLAHYIDEYGVLDGMMVMQIRNARRKQTELNRIKMWMLKHRHVFNNNDDDNDIV